MLPILLLLSTISYFILPFFTYYDTEVTSALQQPPDLSSTTPPLLLQTRVDPTSINSQRESLFIKLTSDLYLSRKWIRIKLSRFKISQFLKIFLLARQQSTVQASLTSKIRPALVPTLH